METFKGVKTNVLVFCHFGFKSHQSFGKHLGMSSKWKTEKLYIELKVTIAEDSKA